MGDHAGEASDRPPEPPRRSVQPAHGRRRPGPAAANEAAQREHHRMTPRTSATAASGTRAASRKASRIPATAPGSRIFRLVRSHLPAVGPDLAGEDCGASATPCSVASGTYFAATPPWHEGDRLRPAVLFLHGAGGSGASAIADPVLAGPIVARGYALLAPNGSARADRDGAYFGRGAPQEVRSGPRTCHESMPTRPPRRPPIGPLRPLRPATQVNVWTGCTRRLCC